MSCGRSRRTPVTEPSDAHAVIPHDRRCREHIAGPQAGRCTPGGILARHGWAVLGLVPSRFGLCTPDAGASSARSRQHLVFRPLARRRRHRVWLGLSATARVCPSAHCSFRQDASPASGAVSAVSSLAAVSGHVTPSTNGHHGCTDSFRRVHFSAARIKAASPAESRFAFPLRSRGRRHRECRFRSKGPRDDVFEAGQILDPHRFQHVRRGPSRTRSGR